MENRVSSRCREWIHASLAGEGEGGAAAFVEAVVEQTAHPLGSAEPPSEEAEARVVAEVVALLRAAQDPADPALPDPARRLRGNPLLLAAFFANIDLLYQHHYPDADAVAALVMRTME